MLQQINLYKQLAKPPRYDLTVEKMLQITILVIALLFCVWIVQELFSVWQNSQLHVLEFQQASLTHKLRDLTEYYTNNLQNNALELENENLRQELASKRQFLIYVNQTNLKSSSPVYSKYFLGLADSTVKNVWLKTIDFNAGEREITLSGSALDTQALTAFLQKLTENTEFSDKKFKILQLKNSSQTNGIMDFLISTKTKESK